MVTLPDGFLTEAIDKDNRSYQYEITITLADSTELVITNEDLIESGGVVIDEAVSNDDALDIGSCIVQKCTITLRNFDGEFDEYDFRNAVVVVRIWLPIPGEVKGFRRGTYIVKELPVYNESTITLTCYDYMTALDILVSSVNLPTTATPITLMVSAICQACGVQRVYQNLPLDSTTIVVPNNDTLTCRELMSYIAQMNGMNCRFDADGKLYFTWFSDGFAGTTLRALMDGSVRTVENGDIRITYPLAGEVVWNDQIDIPSLYTLDAERYDTVVTGVRIVLNTSDTDAAIDATTYVSGTSDYMISVEDNPLITTNNASAVLACLAANLIGFKYRKASFSHIGMPWLMAGDSARIYDAKGIGHNVLISSTVFTSLERQTTVSSGESAAVATPSRFTPATKRYAQQMQYINPIISDINTRIATANGLYETTEVDQITGATIYYLHNKPDKSDSDIQIMVSTVGVMVTANGTDPNPTWYGLMVDGNLIANILSASGINADWINTGALTLADNGTSTDDPSLAVYYTAGSGTDFRSNVYSWGFETLANASWGESWMRYSYERTILVRTIYDSANDVDNRTEYTIRIDPQTGVQAYTDRYENGTHISTTGLFNFNFANQTFTILGQTIALQSTPTFTAASGVTVSKQTWSKVGNVVTGDLTLSKNAAISTTTVDLGTLSEHPGHTVIANARTATVQMRASIDSSGVIHINSPSSVAANTTIYLSLSFVAA